MAGGGESGPADDAGQSLGRAWQPYRGVYDVPGRLRRSATLALIVSPVGLIVISVIRLLIVADYNPVTASAIVSSGGYVDTLLGTIIPLVPIFAPYVALVLLFFNRVIPAILMLLATAFMAPVVPARATALALAGQDWHVVTHRPHAVLVVLGGLALAFGGLLVLELMGLGFAVMARTVATVACIVLIPFTARLYPFPLSNQFYSGLIKRPWLPAEAITLTSGQRFTGYVLSDNGTWLVVLADSTRTIHYYRSAQVAAQQICQIELRPRTQPLIPLYPADLHAPTQTPVCARLLTGTAER
ncbi:MAG: hypothetical protein ACLPKI_29210 [Streptosporangiaceae bacterium]